MLVTEASQHRRSDRYGVLLLDATHHPAQVTGFDHHSHALGLDCALNRLGNLRGKTLLNLQTPGKDFDQPRNFTEANYFAIWDVGHVHLTEEWQHVVFAQAEHLDVFHNDHLVIVDGEESFLQHRLRILLVTFDQMLIGAVHAVGSTNQAFAFGVFPEANDHLAHQIFERGAGNSGRFRG